MLAGSKAAPLNVTLQLTTTDFLPVSTLLHAAAKVWVSLHVRLPEAYLTRVCATDSNAIWHGVTMEVTSQGVDAINIQVISATARHAAQETNEHAGARQLLEAQDTVGNASPQLMCTYMVHPCIDSHESVQPSAPRTWHDSLACNQAIAVAQ